MASRFVLPLADVGNGISPSDGAQLFFFATGTSIDKDTFTSKPATTKNANPVIADGDGVFPQIWIEGSYKVVLKDKNNVQAWEEDPIISDSVESVDLVDNYTTFRAKNSSLLTDGNVIKVTDDKIGGDFIIKTGTVTDNGGTLIVFTDDTNRHGERLVSTQGVFNFLWFGGGTADDRPEIVAADAAAALAGVSLYFPQGIYTFAVLFEDSIQPTASWFSDGAGATLRNTNLSLSSDTLMLQYLNQNDLILDRIHLDGQITITGSGTPNLDHGTPSDANIDDYTRCAGLTVSICTNITIMNCRTDNIFRASFRSDSSSKDILFQNCTTNRNRGTFGDPFYSQVVRAVRFVNCFAFDYTRIGFVYEGVAGLNDASDLVSHSGCYAEFAHDNSTTQNAAGFWVENCNEYHCIDGFAVNTVGGFQLTATDSVGDNLSNGGALSTLRTYNLTSCTAISVVGGLNINPDDKSAVFNIANFIGHVEATAATDNGTATQFIGRNVISLQAGILDFVVNITNAAGRVDNALYATNESYGFFTVFQPVDSTAQGIVSMDKCWCEFSDAAKLRSDAYPAGGGRGFFNTLGEASTEVHIKNSGEIGSTNDAMSIGLTPYADKMRLYIDDCRPEFINSSGDMQFLQISNCAYVDTPTTVRCDQVRISDCDVQKCFFNGNDFIIKDSTVVQLTHSTDSPHLRHDSWYAENVRFNGNLSAAATCAFTIPGTREYRTVFNACTFHNSAGATNTFTFILHDTAFSFIMGSGNIIDDRITNYYKRVAANFTTPKVDVDADQTFGIFTTIDS